MKAAAEASIAAFTLVCGAAQTQATVSFAVLLLTAFVLILLAQTAGHLHSFLRLSQLPVRTMLFPMLFTTLTYLKLCF